MKISSARKIQKFLGLLIRWTGIVVVLFYFSPNTSNATSIAQGFPVVWGTRDKGIFVSDMGIDSQNNVWLIGRIRQNSLEQNVRLWKFNADGHIQNGFPKSIWSGYDEDGNGQSLAPADDGSVYAVGSVYEHLAFWKLDSEGNPAPGFPIFWGLDFKLLRGLHWIRTGLTFFWTKATNQEFHSSRGTAVSVDPEGNIWIAGYDRIHSWNDKDYDAPRRTIAVWKSHPDGKLFDGFPKIWNIGNGESFAVQATADKSGVWILGYVYTAGEVSTVAWKLSLDGTVLPGFPKTLMVRKARDTEMDARTSGLSIGYNVRAEHSISLDKNGNLWWTGCLESKCSLDKLDAQGTRIKGYPKPLNPFGESIASGGDDLWIVGPSEGGQLTAWKQSADGKKDSASILRWKPENHDSFYAKGAAVDKDGFIWTAGDLNWGTNSDVFVLKLNPNQPTISSRSSPTPERRHTSN